MGIIKVMLGEKVWNKLEDYCITTGIIVSDVLYNENNWNNFEKWASQNN